MTTTKSWRSRRPNEICLNAWRRTAGANRRRRSAEVKLGDGSQIPIAVSASLDPTQLDTHNSQRNGDLRSPHFFDVDADPAMTFSSTKITGADPKYFTIEGDLTMHGQTHPVALIAQVVAAGQDAARTRYYRLRSDHDDRSHRSSRRASEQADGRVAACGHAFAFSGACVMLNVWGAISTPEGVHDDSPSMA